MDMDIPMDIHRKSMDMDMDMDGKFHIHGNPGMIEIINWSYMNLKETGIFFIYSSLKSNAKRNNMRYQGVERQPQ